MVVPLNVRLQHVPQAAEFHPVTADAPPMNGNEGSEPNVVKPFVKSPFAPSEHATVSSDCADLSYTESKETESAIAMAQRPRVERIEVSFIAMS